MKHYLQFLLLFLNIGFANMYSQSLFFKTGRNYSKYIFEPNKSSIVRLNDDSGSFFELGSSLPIGTSRFTYEYGISLNELNSALESPSKVVRYKTDFIGIDNAFLYSIIKSKNFSFDAKIGFQLQSMIYGKQEIERVLYDLKNFDEFNGVFFRQSLGAQIKLLMAQQLNFTIGYDYLYNVYNSNNSSLQSLLINSSQIKFGLYYKIDDGKKSNLSLPQLSISNKSSLNVDSTSNNNISNAKTFEDKSNNNQTSNSSVVAIPINGKEDSGGKGKIGVNLNPKIVSKKPDLNSTFVSSNSNSSTINSSNLKDNSDSNQQKQLENISKPASNVRIVRQPSAQSRIPTTVVGNSPSVNNPNSSIIKNFSELNSKIENTINGKKNNINSNTVRPSVNNNQNDSNTNADILKSIMERLNQIEYKLNINKKNGK